MSELIFFNPYLLAGIAVAFAVAAIVLSITTSRKVEISIRSESVKPVPSDSINRRLAKLVLLFLSIFSAIIAAYAFFANFRNLSTKLSENTIYTFVSVAHAESQAPPNPALSPLVMSVIPYILVAVFVSMIAAFAVAVSAVLWLPNTTENEKRLNAADGIVKTFGGFFIGFATSLLNLH